MTDQIGIGYQMNRGQKIPRRPQVRLLINFGEFSCRENSRSRRKNYLKSDTHSSGICTVKCVCKNPKLIVSPQLFLYSYHDFESYYGFASMTMLVIWLHNFLYYGHTCDSVCDASSYLACKEHVASGERSMNHLWNFSKLHLMFLRPDNLMLFLVHRAIFLNARASIKQENRKQDISMNELRCSTRINGDASVIDVQR